MLAALKRFFAKTDGAFKGVLNPEELYRSILTSLGSGTTVGIAMVFLQAILSHVGSIFPNPTVASLASALLTLVLDLLRRQNQGTTPSPAPNPQPAHAATSSPQGA